MKQLAMFSAPAFDNVGTDDRDAHAGAQFKSVIEIKAETDITGGIAAGDQVILHPLNQLHVQANPRLTQWPPRSSQKSQSDLR